MQNPRLIDDPRVMARLRSLTTEVPEQELEEFIHYAHVSVLREASHRLGLFVLLRRTNPESIKFVGYPGFVPKPLACKPKTATTDARIMQAGGALISHCAGLVVDPRLVGRSAFGGRAGAHAAAIATWDKYWAGGPPRGFRIQNDPQSGYYGCVMRCGEDTQVYPHSRTSASRQAATDIRTQPLEQPGATGFQLLPDRDIDRHALGTLPKGCSYIHGDYDLYALVHKDNLSGRNPRTGKFEEADHRYGDNWKAFEALVRSKINLDMIQHGSQEHFSDHTDETVDMFCPTVDRSLWHVKLEGVRALERVYEQAFEGRRPMRMPL
jgi:hypothetical protein